MTEINKNDVKFNPVVAPKVQKSEVAQPKSVPTEDIKDYKEAAAAPGAESLGRAQVMINKTDSVDSSKQLWENPAMIERSDALFNAAEKVGLSYPVAATFATQEA